MAISKEQIVKERNLTRNCFDTEEKCINELATIAHMLNNKAITRNNFNKLKKALSLMFLYCPKTMKKTVENAMIQAEILDGLMFTQVWNCRSI